MCNVPAQSPLHTGPVIKRNADAVARGIASEIVHIADVTAILVDSWPNKFMRTIYFVLDHGNAWGDKWFFLVYCGKQNNEIGWHKSSLISI